jgi:ATP-dependent Lhr-like helicase
MSEASKAGPTIGARRAAGVQSASRWFAEGGRKPFPFQREVWQAMLAGESGLLHATTGSGKTLAAWIGALLRVAALEKSKDAAGPRRSTTAPGLRVLWITPMRALATDTMLALREPLATLADGRFSDWQIGLRTGDTGSAERQRQARRLPHGLVTTPESLSLMLSRADSPQALGGVSVVVVDEWHELLGNKRGVQLQLALARLRRFNPGLVVWGLSATLGNLEQALEVLLAGRTGRLVKGSIAKRLIADTLIPAETGRFPWAGHLGLTMLAPVVAEIDTSASTLVFCNTRSQAERWYQALLEARPDWAGVIALHHGSLDRAVREWVEGGLKSGSLKAVVCTSSLDLGVDFSPVERVLQIGSAKGVARLLQRAGRSGHSPGRPSRVTLVPTHALELAEAAAARDAIAAGQIEVREPPNAPLDVLVQHLVTIAAGTGFVSEELYAEVQDTHAYRALSSAAWHWALDFVSRGGPGLGAYPEYRRVVRDEDGGWRVTDKRLALRHRMAIGTIVSDASMQVAYMGGQRLGTVEESFIGRLRKGDCFLFGGRMLELVRVHEMTAWVRRATGRRAAIPRWNGGRMPLSNEMAAAVLARLAQAAAGRFDGPEMGKLEPLLRLQQTVSALPQPELLLMETLRSREGHHLFVYPFAGRQVHLGLASLFAARLAQRAPATFSIAVNDYGFELLSSEAVDWTPLTSGQLFSPDKLLEDVLASLNAGELARRRFREIAQIAGLIFPGFPGAYGNQAVAGLVEPVLGGVSRSRRGQSAAWAGRTRGARAGTRDRSFAKDARAARNADAQVDRAFPALAVLVSAAR